MTAESPVRGRRGRAAAKYSTRTRVQQAANLDSLPTSVADILNVKQIKLSFYSCSGIERRLEHDFCSNSAKT